MSCVIIACSSLLPGWMIFTVLACGLFSLDSSRPYPPADTQPVKVTIQDASVIEVDLAIVCRFEKFVPLIWEDLLHHSFRHFLSGFSANCTPTMLFQKMYYSIVMDDCADSIAWSMAG